MSSKSVLIGITGNIGSGKSAFCAFLQELGCKIVFSDEIAKKQLNESDSIKAIVKRWGPGILISGKPDRKRIAEIVFQDRNELSFLNNLVHPKTLVALQDVIDNSDEDYLFLELPLLFETGLQNCLDYIVLIYANPDRRLKYLEKSGLSTLENLKSRMVAQIDDINKIPLCDMVVANNGSLAMLKKKASELVDKRKEIQPRDKIPFSM